MQCTMAWITSNGLTLAKQLPALQAAGLSSSGAGHQTCSALPWGCFVAFECSLVCLSACMPGDIQCACARSPHSALQRV